MPTSALKLRGSRAAKARRNEPQPDPAIPSCRSWLDAEAKREWRRVSPELAKMKVLSKLDRSLLAAYCASWSQFVAGVRQLQKDGPTYRTESGLIKRHPAASLVHQAARDVLAFASEFGLSPSARVRLKVTESGPDDFDQFLAQRGL